MRLNTRKRGLQILYQIQVINMKFKYAFKAHSSLFNHGTHYITSIPGLMTFRAQNGMLNAFTDADLDKKDVYISSEHLVSDGWNDISLDGNGETIKLTVNGHVFTLYSKYVNKVYSGFSTENYISPTFSLPSGSAYKLIFNITTGSDMSVTQPIFARTDVDRSFYVQGSSKTLSYYTGSSYPGTTTITPNTKYWVGLWYNNMYVYRFLALDTGEYKSTTLLPELSTSSSFWKTEGSSTSSEVFSNYHYTIGANLTTSAYWGGDISLTKILVTAGDDVLFNGKTAVEGTDYTINGTLTSTETGLYPTFNLGKLNTYANSWLVLKDIQAIKIEE